MKILKLTLKAQWFHMINSGVKLEEYREIKLHWLQRLVDISNYPAESKDDYANILPNILDDILSGHDPMKAIGAYYCRFEDFNHVEFTNGYGKHRPRLLVECKGITIGVGKPEWGATTEQTFIISLGAIIERHNI